MNPCCRILTCCRHPLGLPTSCFPKSTSSLPDAASRRFLRRKVHHGRRIHRPAANSAGCPRPRTCRDRGVAVVRNVASNYRRMSTSGEPRIGGDKSFEGIYVQGFDVKLKPLVFESVGSEVVEERDPVAEVGALEKERALDDGSGVRVVEREEVCGDEGEEKEKEAWELLRTAVVNYCGNPVGTVAANDPADSQPLNYDQVFIRDFIPSAIAFLLKGETEIVRNFLLHTLQLQVHFA